MKWNPLLFPFFLFLSFTNYAQTELRTSAPLSQQLGSATGLDLKIKTLEIELQDLKTKENKLLNQLEDNKLLRVKADLTTVGFPASEAVCELVQHAGMALCYDEWHEQPLWVAHLVTPDVVDGNLNRTNNFRPDEKVKSGSAIQEDYWFSGYDRGHIAPSADFRWSKTAISESYLYSNMSPQLAELNRERWAELEGFVRSYVIANGEQVYVVAAGVLIDDLPRIGTSEVSVPKLYYKVLLDIEGAEQKGIGFLLPNAACDYPLMSYTVTIDSIEALTGIDFFSNLPEALEKRVEASYDFAAWKQENDVLVDDVNPMRPPLPKGMFNTVQARLYIGESITVCGTVVATKYSQKSGATFLNLDKKFPNQIFSASIWKTNRTNFSYAPEVELLGQKVCLTGKLTSYQGKPTMNLENERKVVVLDGDSEF